MFLLKVAVRVLPLVLFCVPLVHAEYTIDDRNSSIRYFGGRAWELHADSDGYMGTTTDNACFTAQACYFTVSFAGSGIQLVRYNIHSIAIPVLATVTLDGAAQTGISVPDDQTVVVYDLQGFPYGNHVLRVDLLSWNATEPSHFRLDRAIITDTQATTTITTTDTSTTFLATGTSGTSTARRTISTSNANSQSPPTPGASTARVTKKKSPTAAIAGGVIAGIAILSVVLVLFIYLRRRRSRARKDEPKVEKVRPQQLISSRFDPRAPPLLDPSPRTAVPVPIRPHAYYNGHLPPPTATTTTTITRPPTTDRFSSPPPPTPFPPPQTSTTPLLMMPIPTPASPTNSYPSTPRRKSQALSTAETTTETDALSIPRSMSPSGSTSSHSALLPRLGRPLRDDEAQAAADLLKQGVPPSDVTRILEAMQREEDRDRDGVTSVGHASISWNEKPSESAHAHTTVTPPATAPGPSHSRNQEDPFDASSPPPYYEARS